MNIKRLLQCFLNWRRFGNPFRYYSEGLKFVVRPLPPKKPWLNLKAQILRLFGLIIVLSIVSSTVLALRGSDSAWLIMGGTVFVLVMFPVLSALSLWLNRRAARTAS